MLAPDARRRTLGFEFLKPARSGRDVVVVEGSRVARRRQASCSTARRSRSSAASTSRSSGRTAPARRRCSRRSSACASRPAGRCGSATASMPAYFSQHEAELDERGSVLDAAMSGTGLKRPEAQTLLGRFLFSGWDEHEKPRRGALGRRAAPARARDRRRLGRELPRARRADEPPRPRVARVARGGARGVPGHGAARLARPRGARRGRRAGCSRSRSAGSSSYPGGWADYVRAQEAEAAALRRRRPSRSARSRSGRRSRSRRRSSSSRRRSRAPRPRRGARAQARGRLGATRRSSPRTATRARISRRCSAAGKRCSKRADRRLGDRVEDEDRLVRARLARAPARWTRRAVGRTGSTSRGRSPARLDLDEHARAALDLRRDRGRRARSAASIRGVLRGEPLGRVPVTA